ncbi:hypothetical protein PAHAL_2G040200 [Panicum hallii]|uniref:Uncharacterized protein n=1 Tax=Panicum hallii TaxID=206008 RepID=A0A2T8KMV3_9POAL|nr:hypothetical protein PAHAL_2G040200 [Panicum hallii]
MKDKSCHQQRSQGTSWLCSSPSSRCKNTWKKYRNCKPQRILAYRNLSSPGSSLILAPLVVTV